MTDASLLLSFRPPGPADVETIARFQEAMARETEGITLDAETVRRGVAAVLADPSLGRYWLAEAEGELVASLLLTLEWSDWRNRRVWWIQSVWVEPAWRGRGVYRALYSHVQQEALADPGIAGIRLYVDRRNARAQAVYRALGMDGEHYTVFEWMKE
ncbi:MAG: GNAT family N-acetyltransferase [Thermoanaerobaculia bacterium]